MAMEITLENIVLVGIFCWCNIFPTITASTPNPAIVDVTILPFILKRNFIYINLRKYILYLRCVYYRCSATVNRQSIATHIW